MKILENNNGITLVALIVTIVIMLILVAIGTRVVIDTDLINQAQQATDDFKEQLEEESSNKYSDYIDEKVNIYAPGVLDNAD